MGLSRYTEFAVDMPRRADRTTQSERRGRRLCESEVVRRRRLHETDIVLSRTPMRTPGLERVIAVSAPRTVVKLAVVSGGADICSWCMLVFREHVELVARAIADARSGACQSILAGEIATTSGTSIQVWTKLSKVDRAARVILFGRVGLDGLPNGKPTLVDPPEIEALERAIAMLTIPNTDERETRR